MKSHLKGQTNAKQTINLEKKITDLAILIVVFLSLIWIFFAPKRGIVHYRQVVKDIDTLRGDTKILTAQNIQLQKEISELENNMPYLEEIARKKYGLIKPNEMIFVFNSSE